MTNNNTSEACASARAYIRRESLDIYNRLHSIETDIAFIDQVRMAYPTLPLIPNLRCGAWYTDPAIAHPGVHAYFKSTDGHHGNWSFNLRRPNLHLLPVAVAHGGLDTRGKTSPDALSKTVPIWCAVVNRALRLRDLSPPRPVISAGADRADEGVQESGDAVSDLHTPPGTVGAHEHTQIASHLDGWAADLANSSYALPALKRSLRPLWITPGTTRFPHIAPDAGFLPVICVSASRAIGVTDEDDLGVGLGRRVDGFSYVQGSGDDHELWSQGLTPQLFWQHRAELLMCSRAELETLVPRLITITRDTAAQSSVDNRSSGSWITQPTPIAKVGGRIALCTLTGLPRDLPVWVTGAPNTNEETALIIVDESDALRDDIDSRLLIKVHSNDTAALSDSGASGNSSRVLHMRFPPGKRGHHIFLHDVLPRAISFASPHLNLGRAIYVAGGDGCIGVALALLQLFFDSDGRPHIGAPRDAAISKSSVRTRLEWIIASLPQANPARAILKRVNDFLLSPHLRGGKADEPR
ncbi:tRNA A64-2'-O-ribosylphosphate transferase [Multifurca ochricompacta]|uniref:tRNA A64-2'-O-ribosylphosphate transferase n=1 Tax=Multifurca ochricompacta TaxID=376703 RepID=A0AAD4M3R5_9AGAM|nr:tRNA A64-2'-O-ribosylphosphate transferase [Multifurca ochricompacta]